LDRRVKEPWRLREAAARFKKLPIKIDDQAQLTVSEIGVRARRYAAELERVGKRLDLVIVDHLGIAKPSTRYAGNKTNETGEISGALAALAKQLNCHVIAACQLNRDVEGRDVKRPQLSDLRNSGDIEQDGHIVTFLYRPAYYLERAKHDDPDKEAARIASLAVLENNLEFIVAKNRNGPIGTVECFVDIANNAVRNLVRAS
jgi:replicative DNA helicase